MGHPQVWPSGPGLTLRWTCLHLHLCNSLNISGLGDSQMSRQESLSLPSSQMTLGLGTSIISYTARQLCGWSAAFMACFVLLAVAPHCILRGPSPCTRSVLLGGRGGKTVISKGPAKTGMVSGPGTQCLLSERDQGGGGWAAGPTGAAWQSF